MSLLNCITIFVIGSSLMTSSNFESEPINPNPLVPLNLANKLPDNLPKISGFNVPMIVKLVPYEVPAQGGTNYADVSLKISNTSRRKVEVEISQITVLAGESNYVLLNASLLSSLLTRESDEAFEGPSHSHVSFQSFIRV